MTGCWRFPRPAKVSHVPSKTETLVRDMGDGHSEIDYATEYRRLDEEFVWFGRLKREKVPGYIEALESAHGAAVAHDALVIGPPHTLIYRFDVLRRQERPHLAFGFGPHVCLGANLARMEARVLFDELLRTFPDFQVTGPAVRGRSTLVAMVSELPAAFGSRDPARARV